VDIILATLNARYLHPAFGLRYLRANLGALRDRAQILEFDIHQRPLDIAERILAHRPRIVGFGVYIWNVTETTQVVAALKKISPATTIALGGPEVSYGTDDLEICQMADHIIPGEGEVAFAELCRQLVGRASSPSLPKIGTGQMPVLQDLTLPYDLYTADDLAHRITYVEASRGCPFECEFCLSALDAPVRQFPLDRFLAAMQSLLDRGAHQFKFVDRTFNLHLPTATAILDFFLERYRPGLFLHFEMIPDRLPETLREIIVQFPPGAIQFEVGLQTFNEEVAARIHRRQDNAQAIANLQWLRQHTGVHIHADLIAGLPGESLESFAAGFDRLAALRPHVIQVGILKRLRGAPIARHDADWQMVYNPAPPYDILQNNLIDFPTMQRLKRFARYWEIVVNRGHFPEAAPLQSFARFWEFSDWLYAQTGQTHEIARARLAGLLRRYLGMAR